MDIIDSTDHFHLTYNNTETPTPNNVKFYGKSIA